MTEGAWVMWDGKNTAEVGAQLHRHAMSIERDGSRLHLFGIGLNTFICEGDAILVDGDRLGIRRAHDEPKIDKYLTWTGANVMDFDDFLKLYNVNMAVVGDQLNIYAGPDLMASLRRGDRITKANGTIVVSRAGKDHRN